MLGGRPKGTKNKPGHIAGGARRGGEFLAANEARLIAEQTARQIALDKMKSQKKLSQAYI